jgi:hypothetical protein
MIWIASFDIGKKNFAFYIEEMDEKQIIESIPKNSRYNVDGTCTVKFKKIMNDIYKNGKTILHINEDLTKNCDKDKYLDTEIFHNMVDHLDKYAEYWDKCQSFVIEMQMSFGKNRNPMAVKLGQHCYSYFIFKYGRFKKTIEFPAYHKTQVLGAPKKIIDKKGKLVKMSKPERKKWAVKEAALILEERGEIEVMDNIKTKSKKDDLSDVICQLQAYKFLNIYSGL